MLKWLLGKRVAQIEERTWSRVRLDPKDERVDYIRAYVADSGGIDEELPCIVFLTNNFLIWSYEGDLAAFGGKSLPLPLFKVIERTGPKTFRARAVLPDGERQVVRMRAANHIPTPMVDRFVDHLTRLQGEWKKKVDAGKITIISNPS